MTFSSGVDNFAFSSPPSYYRVMRPRSNSKNFTGVVREILGTAQSVGCTIDHETPQVGMYDFTVTKVMILILKQIVFRRINLASLKSKDWLEKIASGAFVCPEE